MLISSPTNLQLGKMSFKLLYVKCTALSSLFVLCFSDSNGQGLGRVVLQSYVPAVGNGIQYRYLGFIETYICVMTIKFAFISSLNRKVDLYEWPCVMQSFKKQQYIVVHLMVKPLCDIKTSKMLGHQIKATILEGGLSWCSLSTIWI